MNIEEVPILFVVLLSAYLIRITYQISILYLGIKKDDYPENIETPSISVVISARNEASNLMNFLPKVLEQKYPNFEVVVINDRSVDDTQDILRALKLKYAHLKVSKISPTEQHWAGKKYALTLGIKSASNDLIIFTDADCYPSSDRWIKEIVQRFDKGKKVVLGYGAYKKTGGLLNVLIRVEAAVIAMQYLALARVGIPFMGVGRNLAYDRKLFFNNKGYASHMELMSGDDDLFVNEVSRPSNVATAFDFPSITISIPEKSFKDWLEQKRRHLITSIRYSFRTKLTLLLSTISSYIFYISSVMVMMKFSHQPWAYGIIPSFWLVMLICNYFALKRMKSLDLLIWTPVIDVFILLFYPMAYTKNLLMSGNPWKNY